LAGTLLDPRIYTADGGAAPVSLRTLLAGVAVTVVLQTSRDLAIVAAILAAGVVYDEVYLRPRRGTHWILLDPLVSEQDVGD
jgi:hypothetical protein